MQRTYFDPDELEPRAFYKLLTASIVPRPIAWVSTRSADGVDNLAPHSFFTFACADPPVLQFTSVGRKDSLRNIEATGEFVVNFSPRAAVRADQRHGDQLPAPRSASSRRSGSSASRASAWRRRGSPIRRSPSSASCSRHESASATRPSSSAACCRPPSIRAVLDGGLPDVELLRPLARLGKIEWAELGGGAQTTRIPYDEWPGHYERRRPDSLVTERQARCL